jgi:hypothetical protein
MLPVPSGHVSATFIEHQDQDGNDLDLGGGFLSPRILHSKLFQRSFFQNPLMYVSRDPNSCPNFVATPFRTMSLSFSFVSLRPAY